MDIRTHGFKTTSAIVQHTRRCVSGAVGAVSRQVTRVTVHLGDINGDHGGVDKVCRIVAHVGALPAIVVEAVGSDLYAAMGQASQKLKQAMGRRVGRQRTLHRGGPRHAFAAA